MENGFGLLTREVVTDGMRWNRDGLFFFSDFGCEGIVLEDITCTYKETTFLCTLFTQSTRAP